MIRCTAILAIILAQPLPALDLIPGDAAPGALPAGWQPHLAWNAPFISAIASGGSVAIRIAPQKPGDVMVKRQVDLPAGSGPVTLRATVTCTDPKVGTESWQTPHLSLRPLDANGQPIGRGASHKITAPVSATEVTVTLTPPAGTASLRVDAGFLRAGGVLEISSVSVSR